VGVNQGVLFNRKKQYHVDLVKFAELSGLQGRRHEAYTKAVASAKKLRDTPLDITLPDGSGIYTSIVHEVKYFDSLQSLAIYWNPDFIPLVSGQMEASKFMFPCVQMAATSSHSRYALYVLLEKHMWKLDKEIEGYKIVLPKLEVKETLSATEKYYDEWKNVTRKYIKPTLAEITRLLGISLVAKVKGNNVIFTRVV